MGLWRRQKTISQKHAICLPGWHKNGEDVWPTTQTYLPPVCRNVTFEIEEDHNVNHDVGYGSCPYKRKVRRRSLDRIHGLNPAPWVVSNGSILHVTLGAGLTISCGAVEAIRPMGIYVEGHDEDDSTPEKGDDDKTAMQTLLARLLLFVGLEHDS